MKKRTVVSVVLCLFVATLAWSCSSSPEKKDGLTNGEAPPPAYLAEIPADTHYVAAALEPFPGTAFTKLLNTVSPLYDKAVANFKSYGEQGGATQDEEYKAMVAFMEMFQGKMNKEGIESLGLSMTPKFALYGIGLMPIMRMDITDQKKFETTMASFEKAINVVPQTRKLQEVEYREYVMPDEMSVLVRITGTEAIFGFTFPEVSALYLPHFTGTAKLTSSMKSTNALQELAKKHKFQNYAVGFVDLQGIANTVLEPSADLNGQMAEALDIIVRDLPNPECIGEMKSIAARFPRVVAGYDEVTAERMQYRMGLIMGDNLGAELRQVKGSIPAYGAAYSKETPASIGVGINVGEFLKMAQRHANTIRQSPYKCSALMEINQGAMQIAGQAPLIPPVIGQVQGFHGVLENIEWADPTATSGDVREFPQPPDDGAEPQNTPPPIQADPEPDAKFTGVGLLQVSDTGMLIDALKALAPQLSTVEIPADGQLRLAPEALDVPPGLKPMFIGMTKTTVGMAVGDNAKTQATSMMNAGSDGSPLAYMRIDYTTFMKLVDEPMPEANDPESVDIQPLMDMIGTVEMSLDPTESGLFVTISQNLK